MNSTTSVGFSDRRRARFASKILSPAWRDYRLTPAWRKQIFVLATGSISLLLGLEGARSAAVSVMVAPGRITDLERALVLDPFNADLEYRLGLAYSYSLFHLNNGTALEHLKRATTMNPYRPFYWSDLGQACEWVEKACADRAFDSALKLGPMTPYLYWVNANHDLRTGRIDAALALFRRLLELDPGYASSTFDTCLKALRDPEAVFRGLLSRDDEVALNINYAVFLAGLGQDDAARRVWNETVDRPAAFQFDLAKPYLEHLLASSQYEDAIQVWRDLERLGVVAGRDGDNLVFNGGFERAPLDAGFDWRHIQTPYVSVDFADEEAYKGARCLRLDFAVASNQDVEPLLEYIPVLPGQEYALTAQVRSLDLKSDSGPRLRVTNPECQSCVDASTTMAVGTTPWHQIELTFLTGPRTRLLRLSVWRPRSRTFPFEITGRFWLDAVSLMPVSLERVELGEPRAPTL